jgi:hypothetical protein
MRFRKPLYVTTRFMLDHVVSEATQGNLTPMARYVGLGVVGGTGATYLKELARLRGLDQQTRDMLAKGDLTGALGRFFGAPLDETLANPKKRDTLARVLYTAGKAFHDGNATGLPGEFVPGWNRRVQDLKGGPVPDMMNAVEPPVINSLQTTLEKLFQKKSDIGEENLDQWRTAVQEAIETEVVPARRLSTLLGTEAPLTVVKGLQKKLSAGEQLTPQEIQTLGSLGAQHVGRFNEIRKIQKGPKQPSYESQVYQALGTGKDMTPRGKE